MIKDFKPSMITQNHQNILMDLIYYKAIGDFIKIKVDYCGEKVLLDNIFYGKRKIKKSSSYLMDENMNFVYETYRITDPKDVLYDLKDELTYDMFLKLKSEEEEKIGIYKKNYHIDIELFFDKKVFSIEERLIESFAVITGVLKANCFLNKRKEYLELIEKLILLSIEDDGLNTLKEKFLKDSINIDGIIKFNMNGEPNVQELPFGGDIKSSLTSCINEKLGA